jgi:hypothetical protein
MRPAETTDGSRDRWSLTGQVALVAPLLAASAGP